MTIRLIAVDLDGTLLNSRSEIPTANREALRAAAERGVQVVIVTGRRFHSARPFVAQLPFPVTVISSNGARIGTAQGEAFHRDLLPAAVARQVLEIAREFRPYAVAIFDQPTRGQVMMEESAVPEGPLGWYLRNNPDCLMQVPDLTTRLTTDPLQVMFGGALARIEPVEPLLRASAAGAGIHLTWTKYLERDVSILDVMNKGCSKGAALKRWAERCGVQPSEVMAIGDNHNDIEMLQFAGCPVVMGNCTPGLAQDGWPVTLSNDEAGVARAVETYVLNKPGRIPTVR
jgi:5-amino-6-(5-phospho-D-ribitylamino)uracil phosphatase